MRCESSVGTIRDTRVQGVYRELWLDYTWDHGVVGGVKCRHEMPFTENCAQFEMQQNTTSMKTTGLQGR